jgi:hypothetical protein
MDKVDGGTSATTEFPDQALKCALAIIHFILEKQSSPLG